MKAIYFLILYYPVHEVVLRYSGASGNLFFFLRQWPDLLSILILIIAILYRQQVRKKIQLRSTGLTLWVLLFLLYASFLILVTEGNRNAVGFSEVYVLLRYVSIFGAIILLQPKKQEMYIAVKLIGISAIVQTVLGAVQFFVGESFMELFKPVDYYSAVSGLERSFTSNRMTSRSFIIGSAGDFISFSYCIAIGIAVTLFNNDKSWRRNCVLAALYTLLFLAGSRTIFLSAVAAPLIYFGWIQSLGRRLIYTILFPPIAILVFFLLQGFFDGVDYRYDKFSALFSTQIFDSLINQRLGVIFFIVPEYLRSGDFLLGLSPDNLYLVDYVSTSYYQIPPVLLATLSGTVEDLYIVCLFLYYGLPGFVFLAIIFSILWRICSRVCFSEMRIIGALGIIFLILSFFFSLGNQAFENRIFSFYFWLIMGLNGAIYCSRHRECTLVRSKLGDEFVFQKNDRS